MASKDLSYKIGVDSSQGVSGVKQFSRAVQDELRKVDSEFDETASSGEKVAAVLSAMAKDLDVELDRAAQAAEALSRALGPELAGKADVGSLVGDLQRMGLTFEDIVTDADKLAGALKELDQVQVKGIESGLGGVKTKVGELDDASRGAKSALANMIGNASQDLGALSGVAGSAGVAIGQMAEYAADARLSGQGFGSVLKSMAGVAAPIAGIAVATKLIGDHMADVAATEAFNRERVDGFADAMADATVTAEELRDVLSGEEEFGIFARVDENTQNLDENVQRTLGTFDEFMKRLRDPRGVEKYAQDILDSAEAAGLSKQQHNELEDAVKAAMDGEVDGVTVLKASNAGMEDQVLTLVALASARKGTAEGATEAAFREEFYGDTVKDTTDATNEAADATKGYNTELRETGTTVSEAIVKAREWKATLDEAKVSAGGMMDKFDASRVDAVTSSLGEFLEARQPGVDWLDTLGETKTAFKDIFSAIKENEGAIPDIFEVGTEKGRDFRDSIGEASSAVNEQLLGALENAGGNFQKVREQANQLRQEMIKRIELRTGLSMDVPAEKTKILGLVNAVVPPKRQVEVGIAVAKEDLQKLKADLAIEQLQALLPATALQLQVDLAEGDITPAEAAATAQKVLTDNGLEVDLGVNTKKADENLVTFAEKERTALLGVKPTGLADTNADIQAGPNGDGWPGIRVPVIPVLPNGSPYPTGGGAGSAFPSMAPTAFGAPTAATTTGTSMAPLMIPVAPQSQPQEVHLHTHLNAAVIGGPFDVDRAVEDSMRRVARLMPKIP